MAGRPNLVARLAARSDGPRLCLLGHVDTVLGDAAEWTVDPWSGELRDGCVWGRGALDMKSQVAAEVGGGAAPRGGGLATGGGELVIVSPPTRRPARPGREWLCEQRPTSVPATSS